MVHPLPGSQPGPPPGPPPGPKPQPVISTQVSYSSDGTAITFTCPHCGMVFTLKAGESVDSGYYHFAVQERQRPGGGTDLLLAVATEPLV